MEEAAIVLLVLVVIVAGLSAVAEAIAVPYPILLVIGGLALGFVPGVPEVGLEPELVFLLFLPPLLYYAALQSTLRDLRTDVRAIALLAFGLVLLTIVAVAVSARVLIGGLPWPVAFALGAIVSPTDPIAATSIMQRVGAPRRVRTIIEGESLLNDTGAIIAFRVAVAASVGGTVSWWETGLRLPLSALGGIAIGLAVGWVVAAVRQRLDDTPVEITLSLVTPYAAYLPAEELGVSGVLAAVSAGLLTGWRGPTITSARTRIALLSVWKVVVFLGNALLFILVGLQLPVILGDLGDLGWVRPARIALAIAVVVIAVRIVWQFTTPYVVYALDRGHRAPRTDWRSRLVIGWSGMRGGLSLAAALSLPLTTDAGGPFPEREVLIFVTFGVVLVTLLLQGLTLPAMLRRLRLGDDGTDAREELVARRAAVEAALARLDELADEDWTRADTVERMRGLYEFRRHRFAVRAGAEPDSDGIDDRSAAFQRMVRTILDAQRGTLVRLRNEGVIGNEVMARVERELDLEDSRLEI